MHPELEKIVNDATFIKRFSLKDQARRIDEKLEADEKVERVMVTVEGIVVATDKNLIVHHGQEETTVTPYESINSYSEQNGTHAFVGAAGKVEVLDGLGPSNTVDPAQAADFVRHVRSHLSV